MLLAPPNYEIEVQYFERPLINLGKIALCSAIEKMGTII